MHGKCWAFSFDFENHHTRIVTSGEQVQRRMSGYDPETIVILTESMQTRAFLQIPYANAFIFGIGQNKVGAWMENGARDVIVVATASVHL